MFSRDVFEERTAKRLFTRRAALLGTAQAVGFGVLGARLYQLQVIEGQRYAPLAERNRLTKQAIAPVRGSIFDHAGRVLADNEENFRLILTPSYAADVLAVLDRAGRVVTITQEDRDRVLMLARRQALSHPIVVREKLTFADVAKLGVLAPYLPGIESDFAGQRRYYHGRLMSQIVGHVGSVDRFALDDDPELRVPGFRIGKSGVEKGMEDRLRGKGGHVAREVDAHGRIVRELGRVEPVPGRDVHITIDTRLQARITQHLSGVRRGAVVALDVETGAVVAMASTPAVDASAVGEGISDRDWQELVQTAGDPLFNRAVQGQYPPGSTFKMVTALAALEAGKIGLRDRVTCNGVYRLSNHRYRCWNRRGHGPMDLHKALRQSCDVYFYEIAHRVGITRLAEMARRLGFGQVYPGLGVAFQEKAVVPDPSWKLGHIHQPWYGGETLHAGIGQGYVTASPLQLAVMMARLATGRRIEPTLVGSPEQPNGSAVAGANLGLSAFNLQAVQRGLVAAVNSRAGTGRAAAFDDRDVLVAGKTGSAQVTRLTSRIAQETLPWNQRDHALFVSYVPANLPRFAVSVVVEHGMSGGKAAAPLAREVMKTLLDFDGERPPSLDVGAANGLARQG